MYFLFNLWQAHGKPDVDVHIPRIRAVKPIFLSNERIHQTQLIYGDGAAWSTEVL